jgi:hypothetical protein
MVAPLCHPSVWFGLPTMGLPPALTVLTPWMLVVRSTPFRWQRLGLLVVLGLSWAYFDQQIEDNRHNFHNPAFDQQIEDNAERTLPVRCCRPCGHLAA